MSALEEAVLVWLDDGPATESDLSDLLANCDLAATYTDQDLSRALEKLKRAKKIKRVLGVFRLVR